MRAATAHEASRYTQRHSDKQQRSTQGDEHVATHARSCGVRWILVLDTHTVPPASRESGKGGRGVRLTIYCHKTSTVRHDSSNTVAQAYTKSMEAARRVASRHL